MAATMTPAQLRARAIQRAIALGLAGEVERVRFGWYRVPSSTTPGQAYTVRVVEGRYTCDCQAGRSGRACVHAAAVFIRKTEHGGATGLAPAPPAPANVLPFQRAA